MQSFNLDCDEVPGGGGGGGGRGGGSGGGGDFLWLLHGT